MTVTENVLILKFVWLKETSTSSISTLKPVRAVWV